MNCRKHLRVSNFGNSIYLFSSSISKHQLLLVLIVIFWQTSQNIFFADQFEKRHDEIWILLRTIRSSDSLNQCELDCKTSSDAEEAAYGLHQNKRSVPRQILQNMRLNWRDHIQINVLCFRFFGIFVSLFSNTNDLSFSVCES